MRTPLLRVDDLQVAPVDAHGHPSDPTLHGVTLDVAPGEIHGLMGPNGSGKSTLGAALIGAPTHRITRGTIVLAGDDVTTWPIDERAKAGVFLGFQRPPDIAGITVGELLRLIEQARTSEARPVRDIRAAAAAWMEVLGLAPSFLDRHVNDGFSIGEVTRSEIVQLAMARPHVAFLDDVDAGLDATSIRVVADGLRSVRDANPDMGMVVVAHSRRLLDEVGVDHVHILMDGRIVASGGPDVADHLESNGYDAFKTSA